MFLWNSSSYLRLFTLSLLQEVIINNKWWKWRTLCEEHNAKEDEEWVGGQKNRASFKFLNSFFPSRDPLSNCLLRWWDWLLLILLDSLSLRLCTTMTPSSTSSAASWSSFSSSLSSLTVECSSSSSSSTFSSSSSEARNSSSTSSWEIRRTNQDDKRQLLFGSSSSHGLHLDLILN